MRTLTTQGSILTNLICDIYFGEPEVIPQVLETMRAQLSVDEIRSVWAKIPKGIEWAKILRNAGEHFGWALYSFTLQPRETQGEAIALAPDIRGHLAPAKLQVIPKRLPPVRGEVPQQSKPREPYYQFRTPEEFKRECLEGSAIAPEFWGLALEVIEDQEIDPYSHEIDYLPIYDALNQEKYIRFPRENKTPLIAGNFVQAMGETFQLKLNRARADYRRVDDQGNPKPIKYESPKGVGARAFTPPVPEVVQQRILDRVGLSPLEADQKICDPAWFWGLVEAHPAWPIIITEGAKKGLCGLSQGYIVISLTGCHGGCTKNKETGQYSLNPDLIPFAVKGRKIIIALDQDKARKARKTVSAAQKRLARMLQDRGCTVAIAVWEPKQGKGIDDLVVQSGVNALHQAIATALPFEIWERQDAYELALWIVANKLGRHKPNLVLNTPVLGWELTKLQAAIPKTGTVVFDAPTGTGKTNVIAKLTRHLERVISPIHRQSLGRGLASRMLLDYINDIDSGKGWMVGADGHLTRRISLCWDSLLKINEANYPPGTYTVVLDEADQGFRHLVLGGTCSKGGKRPGLLAKARRLIKDAKQVILASAGISEAEIDLVLQLRGEEKAFVVKNEYQGTGYPCTIYTESPGGGDRTLARAKVYGLLEDSIAKGDRIIVHMDTKSGCYIVEAMGLSKGLKPEEILRFDGDTSADPRQREFADNPNKFLAENDIKLLVASPSLTSGVSITVDAFDQVFAFFEGNSIAPLDAMQMPHRYRLPVPRIIFAAAKGNPNPLSPKNKLDYMTKAQRRSHMITHVLGDADLRGKIDTDSPWAQYEAAVETSRHYEMLGFALYLQAYLEHAGHQVTLGELPKGDDEDVVVTLDKLKILRRAIEEQDHQSVANASPLTPEQADQLRDKTTRVYKENQALRRFDIGDFYQEEVTPELVDYDNRGRTRKAINRLLGVCLPDFARDRDLGQMDKLMAWNEPIPMGDLPRQTLSAMAIIQTGLTDLIGWAVDGNRWDNTTERIIECHQRCLEKAHDIKLATGLWVSPQQTPCQFFGMVLRHFGFTTESKREGSQTGGEDNRIRVYWLNPEAMKKTLYYLRRRVERYLQNTDKPIRPHPISRVLLPGVALSQRSPEASLKNEQLSPKNSLRETEAPPRSPDSIPAIA